MVYASFFIFGTQKRKRLNSMQSRGKIILPRKSVMKKLKKLFLCELWSLAVVLIFHMLSAPHSSRCMGGIRERRQSCQSHKTRYIHVEYKHPAGSCQHGNELPVTVRDSRQIDFQLLKKFMFHARSLNITYQGGVRELRNVD
jgi:hypothetical protein